MSRELHSKIAAMRTGGRHLAMVKKALEEAALPSTPFERLESLAQELIADAGAKPSFSTVEGYKYATCITKNEGCCHGVPVGKSVESGDILTIDVGLIFEGYHVDTTTTFFVGDPAKIPEQVQRFLQVGWESLNRSIDQAVVGNSVYDISATMQRVIEEAGYDPVYQLTGHAVGKTLHEDPQIPCVAYKSDKKRRLFEGMTVAIESMFAMGDAELVLGDDGWTYESKDRSLTGMFEDTVLITSGRPEILTRL